MSKEQFQPLREDNPMLAEVTKLYETGSALNEVASPLGDNHRLYEHTNTVQNSGKNTDHCPKNR
jgi:hypothetical protein